MDQQGGKITLLWVPRHVGITDNENADTAAKKALNERIQKTEKYPPQHLTKWIERTHQEERQEKLNNTATEMKKRKAHIRSKSF
jgi:hypothetical protein